MKKSFLLATVFMLISTTAFAADILVEVSPPSDTEDIVGYKVHYGEPNEEYPYSTSVDVGMKPVVNGSMSYELFGVPSTAQNYVVTAYDSAGQDGEPSPVYPFDPPPGRPSIQRIVHVSVTVTVN